MTWVWIIYWAGVIILSANAGFEMSKRPTTDQDVLWLFCIGVWPLAVAPFLLSAVFASAFKPQEKA